MKKFREIENLREEDIKLSDEITRLQNTQGFEIGDEIVIQEKVDGSCASYEQIDNTTFRAYSRRKELNSENNLNGFFEYCDNNLKGKNLNSDYIIFGEWTGKRNAIVYSPNPLNNWFVFDIWDKKTENYLTQDKVEKFCANNNLEYIHTYVSRGKFTSWEAIRVFANTKYSAYGDTQEGIIVKNMTKLVDPNSRFDDYIKIVNNDYKESKKIKRIKPKPNEELKYAEEVVTPIVTGYRVKKVLTKLCDDGELPTMLTQKNMQEVLKKLPKAVFEDCQKEEPEIIQEAGKFAGKAICKKTVTIAKNIIC